MSEARERRGERGSGSSFSFGFSDSGWVVPVRRERAPSDGVSVPSQCPLRSLTDLLRETSRAGARADVDRDRSWAAGFPLPEVGRSSGALCRQRGRDARDRASSP